MKKNKKDVEKIIDSNIENDIITCDYKIANDKDCHIYEIGFIVPECNDSFKEKIEKMEMCFVEKITDIKSITLNIFCWQFCTYSSKKWK